MQKIGVISDTHGYVDDKILSFLVECDQIWHAGDVGSFSLMEQLQQFKPMKCVYGNIDDLKVRRAAKEILVFNCEDKKVMMTHIGGYPGRYEKNVKVAFGIHKPDIFVCGHSHILKIQHDKNFNLLHINPGAAGKSGFHKFRTAVRFEIDCGDIENVEVLEITR